MHCTGEFLSVESNGDYTKPLLFIFLVTLHEHRAAICWWWRCDILCFVSSTYSSLNHVRFEEVVLSFEGESVHTKYVHTFLLVFHICLSYADNAKGVAKKIRYEMLPFLSIFLNLIHVSIFIPKGGMEKVRG